MAAKRVVVAAAAAAGAAVAWTGAAWCSPLEVQGRSSVVTRSGPRSARVPLGGQQSRRGDSANAALASAGAVAAVAVAAGSRRVASRRARGGVSVVVAQASRVEDRTAVERRSALALLVVGVGAAALAAPAPVLAVEDEIESVIDGDTVKLKTLGRCRLIGMNTPETVSPKQKEGAPPDCFGPEASKFTKELLPAGTKVKVETDAGPRDMYGRNLVYLYRAQDNLFVNGELVKRGLARHMSVAPNVKYADVFIKLEKEAQASGAGLWKACPIGAGSSPAAALALKPGSPGDVKNCKDFATYSEAKTWFDKYFPEFGDVAKLDGDGDGKPCEGLLKKEKVKA